MFSEILAQLGFASVEIRHQGIEDGMVFLFASIKGNSKKEITIEKTTERFWIKVNGNVPKGEKKLYTFIMALVSLLNAFSKSDENSKVIEDSEITLKYKTVDTNLGLLVEPLSPLLALLGFLPRPQFNSCLKKTAVGLC